MNYQDAIKPILQQMEKMQYILLGISIYSILTRGKPTVIITPDIREKLIYAMFTEEPGPGRNSGLIGLGEYHNPITTKTIRND